MTDEAFLKRKDLAKILSVTPLTIKRWEAEGLPYTYINHQTRYYDINKVKAWMQEKGENK